MMYQTSGISSKLSLLYCAYRNSKPGKVSIGPRDLPLRHLPFTIELSSYWSFNEIEVIQVTDRSRHILRWEIAVDNIR